MTFPMVFNPSTRVDPYRNSVVLLTHFRGNNGVTAFVDESIVANTLTTSGNASILSDRLELDGTTDYVTAPDSTNWDFPGDFTIEVFGFKTDNGALNQALLSHYDAFSPASNQRGWIYFYRGVTNTFDFVISTAGTSAIANTVTYTLTAGVDYDLCVERSGSTIRFYVNGSFIGSVTQAGSTFNCTSPLAIGSVNTRSVSATDQDEVDGRIKAVRITKGVARYATNTSYTVPSLPLPSD